MNICEQQHRLIVFEWNELSRMAELLGMSCLLRHTELIDPSLFEYGLSLSNSLDKQFGKQTIAAKMTDVPGHTIAIVPHLAKFGIQYLHLGVNPASKVPNVPAVFRWQAPDGSEVIVNYADNYGK
jgi:hypothetical protein